MSLNIFQNFKKQLLYVFSEHRLNVYYMPSIVCLMLKIHYQIAHEITLLKDYSSSGRDGNLIGNLFMLSKLGFSYIDTWMVVCLNFTD